MKKVLLFSELKKELLTGTKNVVWFEKEVDAIYTDKKIKMKVEANEPLECIGTDEMKLNFPEKEPQKKRHGYFFPLLITFGEEKFIFSAFCREDSKVSQPKIKNQFISFVGERVEILSMTETQKKEYFSHTLRGEIFVSYPTKMGLVEGKDYSLDPLASAFYWLKDFLIEKGKTHQANVVNVASSPAPNGKVGILRKPVEVLYFRNIFDSRSNFRQDLIPAKERYELFFAINANGVLMVEFYDTKTHRISRQFSEEACALVTFTLDGVKESIMPIRKFVKYYVDFE